MVGFVYFYSSPIFTLPYKPKITKEIVSNFRKLRTICDRRSPPVDDQIIFQILSLKVTRLDRLWESREARLKQSQSLLYLWKNQHWSTRISEDCPCSRWLGWSRNWRPVASSALGLKWPYAFRNAASARRIIAGIAAETTTSCTTSVTCDCSSSTDNFTSSKSNVSKGSLWSWNKLYGWETMYKQTNNSSDGSD